MKIPEAMEGGATTTKVMGDSLVWIQYISQSVISARESYLLSEGKVQVGEYSILPASAIRNHQLALPRVENLEFPKRYITLTTGLDMLVYLTNRVSVPKLTLQPQLPGRESISNPAYTYTTSRVILTAYSSDGIKTFMSLPFCEFCKRCN